MSAHETTPGQAASTCVLTLSMMSKPNVDPPALGPAFFSPGVVAVSSSSREASQPWKESIFNSKGEYGTIQELKRCDA
jgi:hypothetical protein